MFERRAPALPGGAARGETNDLSAGEATTEAGMRRALGIGGGGRTAQQRPDQARRRHRFVENGEVPVVVLNNHGGVHGGDGDVKASLRSRIDAAEAALATERSARAAAERRLQEASTNIQSLQSQLVHAALAHGEALEAERGKSRELESALNELRAAHAQLTEQGRQDSAVRAPRVAKPRVKAEETAVREAGPAREPQPVSWWLPSYRAKAKKR